MGEGAGRDGTLSQVFRVSLKPAGSFKFKVYHFLNFTAKRNAETLCKTVPVPVIFYCKEISR